MSNIKSIMIVGVGGQGTLLASRLLGNVTVAKNFDVKVSEVHGMSQRGGSVVTYVRYASDEKVCSPVIDKGQADFIISFEKLEGARWLDYLKKGGKLITSTQELEPMPVITGVMEYPSNLIEKIKDKGIDVLAIDALTLAEEAGSSKATNVVLMGVLSNFLDIDEKIWDNAICECVPAKFLEINKKAFELGKNANK
ncbi:MAG: indolepyruvate oxidoreductase subunit beta [Oscillospiraceae bacterium]